MKTMLIYFTSILLGIDYLAAQNHPLERWQREETNEYGTVTRYVYHFKPENQFTFERIIRSDKKKFTSHIVVEGTWKASYFNAFDRSALSSLSPELKEYYEIDELELLMRIDINLSTVVSSTAKYDDGKVEVREQQALANAWGNASIKELIPYQDSTEMMTILSGDGTQFKKVVFQKVK